MKKRIMHEGRDVHESLWSELESVAGQVMPQVKPLGSLDVKNLAGSVALNLGLDDEWAAAIGKALQAIIQNKGWKIDKYDGWVWAWRGGPCKPASIKLGGQTYGAPANMRASRPTAYARLLDHMRKKPKFSTKLDKMHNDGGVKKIVFWSGFARIRLWKEDA